MKTQESMWRYLACLALPASCALGLVAGAGAVQNDAPKSLPPDIVKGWMVVKAWAEAGADVGYMKTTTGDFGQFLSVEKGGPGAMPAFRFNYWSAPRDPVSNWKEGVLATLPDLGVPFGLELSANNSPKETKVTDAGLKGLARLKSLQALSLRGTQVTDKGLKELAGLKNLICLDLGNTPVTNAGLKELAALKSLRSLDVQDTKVTDAGLKELAGLTNLQTLSLFGAKVTEAGISALQKDLPRCNILR
jgi:internalin A